MKIKINKRHIICFMAMLFVAQNKHHDYPTPDMPDVCYTTSNGRIKYFKWDDIRTDVVIWANYPMKDELFNYYRDKYPWLLTTLQEVPILVVQGRIKIVEKTSGSEEDRILAQYEAQINEEGLK